VLPLIDRASRRDFNGGVVENLVIFHHDDQFLALQMVNFSSLHDEGRPADVFYHHRRDTLVIALQMGLLSLILAFHNIGTFLDVAWREADLITVCHSQYYNPQHPSVVRSRIYTTSPDDRSIIKGHHSYCNHSGRFVFTSTGDWLRWWRRWTSYCSETSR
jgi:hypothetical protein